MGNVGIKLTVITAITHLALNRRINKIALNQRCVIITGETHLRMRVGNMVGWRDDKKLVAITHILQSVLDWRYSLEFVETPVPIVSSIDSAAVYAVNNHDLLDRFLLSDPKELMELLITELCKALHTTNNLTQATKLHKLQMSLMRHCGQLKSNGKPAPEVLKSC